MDLALNSKNVPKAFSSTLDMKNNKYVIKTGLIYNYFDIKVAPAAETDGVIRFEKTPPVLIEGIAVVGKKFYKVTPQDLLRGVIRKSRELVVPKREKVNESAGNGIRSDIVGPGSSGDTGTSENIISATSVSEALFGSNEQGTGSETGVEEAIRANLAWEEEVGALFDSLNQEEEFF
jgi:hypothetical protein